MTAISEFDEFEPASNAGFDDKGPFAVDETYWGYIVRSTEKASVGVLVTQMLAWGVGISFCLATLGLWLMPSAVFHGSILGMKIGASVLTASVAVFCLWFASRGMDSEIQIDTKLGEVREVVRNRAGRPSLIGRYGFDAIGSVVIEVGAEHNDLRHAQGALVLRYRNTEERLHIARGSAVRLGALRDRLGRDMMLPQGKTGSANDLAAA